MFLVIFETRFLLITLTWCTECLRTVQDQCIVSSLNHLYYSYMSASNSVFGLKLFFCIEPKTSI